MSKNNKYISAQIQRVLQCIVLMAGNEIEGVEPAKLADALQTSRPDVTRILANLEHANWVERLPKNQNRYRLHKRPVQLSNTVALNINNALRQLQQDQQNYGKLA